MLLVLYTSEEQSLIGSRHFLEHPPISLKQIALNINIEQIGSKHRLYEGIWAIGEPQFKEPFLKTSGSFPKTVVKFDSIEPMRSVLDGQVDLWNYYTRGIPAVMLSSGGFPEHHALQDRIDVIDFEHLDIAAKMLTSFIGTLGNV